MTFFCVGLKTSSKFFDTIHCIYISVCLKIVLFDNSIHYDGTNLDPRRCLKSPVSASVGVVGVCAYGCDCGCVNVSGSVCDVCAWAWLCTVAVVVVAVAAAEDEDEDEACARCSRHGPLPLDRSSMISSSPSSTMLHPPAEKTGGTDVSYIGGGDKSPPLTITPHTPLGYESTELLKVTRPR